MNLQYVKTENVDKSLKRQLQNQFYTVIKCEEEGDRFIVQIGKGYSAGIHQTSSILRTVLNYVGGKYPSIEKIIPEKENFQLVLKPYHPPTKVKTE